MLLGAAPPVAAPLAERAAQAANRAQSLQNRAGTARAAARRAQQLAKSLSADIAITRTALAESERRLHALRTQRRAAALTAADARAPVARLTAALVTLARRPSALALVQPASLDEQAHLRAVLATLEPQMASGTAKLRTAEAALDTAIRAEGRQFALQERIARQLAAQREALTRYATTRQATSEAAIDAALKEQDRALAFADAATRLSEATARIESERKVAARLAELPPPAYRAAPLGPTGYGLPLAAPLVTGFGERNADGRPSPALTFGSTPGRAVVAPRAGRVIHAGLLDGYGEVVILAHGGGWTTILANLGTRSVEPRQTVRSGERLGTTSSVPLRFEVRRHGRPVNPAALVG